MLSEPICESGDFLAKNRRVAPLDSGSLIAVMSAGAYGYSMSSNYNSRMRVPEVLVTGDKILCDQTKRDSRGSL